MEYEWPLVPLREVAEVFDGPHATPKKTYFGPVFLGISSLQNGRIDLSQLEYLSEDDFEKWTRRVLPRPGDVVFSYETRIGQAAIIPPNLRCCLGRRMALVRTNPSRLRSGYFLYYFLSSEFQELLRTKTVYGSTVERISLTEFPDFKVRVPPIQVQDQILSVLGTLDDRIALLHQTSATLEAIAKAIFKSWFIDFDPVRAKVEDRDPQGMDAEMVAFFPAEFEESELGPIPQGWRQVPVKELYDGLFDGVHGTPAPSETGAMFLGIKNFTPTSLDFTEIRRISEEDWPKWTRRVTPTGGDIVFTYEATLGYFAVVPSGLRCCLGRRTALVRPKADVQNGLFLFHSFISKPFQNILMARKNHGSTVDRIPLSDFPNYPILWPGLELSCRFTSIVAPLWERIHANQAQMQSLREIRDTLLPRLISGQLRVPEAQEAVEEVLA